jgi:cell division protein FtsB
MSLDGLRAWIGLVERKLAMRTRVFLVLVAIAIGGAGAGIVLAIGAQNDAVTKGDLQAVRDELAGTAASAEAPSAGALEAEVETLQAEVAALRAEAASKSKGSGPAEAPSAAPRNQAGASGGGEVPPTK